MYIIRARLSGIPCGEMRFRLCNIGQWIISAASLVQELTSCIQTQTRCWPYTWWEPYMYNLAFYIKQLIGKINVYQRNVIISRYKRETQTQVLLDCNFILCRTVLFFASSLRNKRKILLCISVCKMYYLSYCAHILNENIPLERNRSVY